MTESRFTFTRLIPFLIIATLLWLPGCSGQSAQKPAQKPQMTTQQKPTPPAQMKSMLTGEERLLENLRQQAQKEKLATQQAAAEAKLKAEQAALAKKAQREALAKQKADQEVENKQKAQEEAQVRKAQPTTPSTPTSPNTPSPSTPQEPQSQQDQTTPPPTEPVLAQGSQGLGFWQQATQSVQKLNQDWNTLEPQASKAGLGTNQGNNIQKALDDLTAAVSAQNTEKSLLAAIELLGQSGSLAKVFIYPVPPEYFQLNYQIMMSSLESEKMQWSTAEARIPKMQSSWSTVKAGAKGKNPSLMNQTELSIRDYEQAIRIRQKEMISSKAEIALQNLKAVEEALTAMTS